MSIPSIQGLSVAASQMLNVVRNHTTMIGTRLVSHCQYRPLAGTALVVSTIAAFGIGWLLSDLILRISDIGIDPNSGEERIPDGVFTVIGITVNMASIAVINTAVYKKLHLPLSVWGSVLITITTMAFAGLAFALTCNDSGQDDNG